MCLFVCLFVCLSVCVFVYLSVCMFVCLCVCLFVCLSVCLFVSLSLRLSVRFKLNKKLLCIGRNLAAERVRVREEGQAVRDNLRLNMPGPTQREQRLLMAVC